MSKIFTQSFKLQAVEKALNRREMTSQSEIADELGIGRSTLSKWIAKSRNNELVKPNGFNMTDEKRPQDYNLTERMDLIIRCSSLDEEQISQLCREEGIFPHHIKQWKKDFTQSQKTVKTTQDNKHYKAEIKRLRKEINRKDKALAETAALLVLQKKVQDIWGNNEDDLQ
jgi:transposase-like protein